MSSAAYNLDADSSSSAHNIIIIINIVYNIIGVICYCHGVAETYQDLLRGYRCIRLYLKCVHCPLCVFFFLIRDTQAHCTRVLEHSHGGTCMYNNMILLLDIHTIQVHMNGFRYTFM